MRNPPATGNAELDRFLSSVKDELETATKPTQGWKLSDFHAEVSEVISDERDLIDIIRNWDDINTIKANFETEITRYENLYADSKILGDQYQDHAEIFAQIMEWWSQNVRLIEDIEAFLIEVNADTSAAASSASAAATSETNAKTSETKAKTSETNAKTSETNAGNSASSASSSASSAASSATAAAGSASQASSSKSAAASSASAAASSASAAEDAAVRAEAGATTVGNAQAVLTARDQAVTAKNGAVTAQTAAETAAANAATVATAKAVEEVNKLKAGAPAAFDTLLEIANELGDNETERAALTNSIAAKADTGFGDVIGVIETGDFNALDLSEAGLYRIRGGTGYVTNMPTTTAGLWWNVILVSTMEPTGANTKMFFAHSATSSTVYVRVKYGTTWGSWTTISTTYSSMTYAVGTAASPTTTGYIISASILQQVLRYFLTGSSTGVVGSVGQSLMTATDAAAARTAIGAGTSNLALGTTSSTAKAGDYQPTAANISDSTTVGRNVLKATTAADARTAIGAAESGHTHSEYATTTSVSTVNGRVSARPALFSGAGTPPASIPGAVVGDWWIDTSTMDLYKITVV